MNWFLYINDVRWYLRVIQQIISYLLCLRWWSERWKRHILLIRGTLLSLVDDTDSNDKRWNWCEKWYLSAAAGQRLHQRREFFQVEPPMHMYGAKCNNESTRWNESTSKNAKRMSGKVIDWNSRTRNSLVLGHVEQWGEYGRSFAGIAKHVAKTYVLTTG